MKILIFFNKITYHSISLDLHTRIYFFHLRDFYGGSYVDASYYLFRHKNLEKHISLLLFILSSFKSKLYNS